MHKNFFDIIVVGCGLVGSAVAIGLMKKGFSVGIIDTFNKIEFNNYDLPDIRVSAINVASVNFLKKIEAWQFIEKMRYNPYKKLKTWDIKKAYVSFSSELLGMKELGYMVENNVLKCALFEVIKKNNINFYFSKLNNIIKINKRWIAELSNGKKLYTKLIIGADGINSKTRKLSKIKYNIFTYDHACILISAKNEFSGNTTWQKFDCNGSTYAFLPLYKNLSSLVWYDTYSNIKLINNLTEKDFKKKIIKHFFPNKKVNNLIILKKKVFLLKKLYVKSYIKEGIVLVGDAAHSINPIAGQGLNLGYKDALALITVLTDAKNNNECWYSKNVLKKYQNMRYYDNIFMQNSIDLFYNVFTNNFLTVKLIRNLGMFLIQKNKFLKKILLNYAVGGIN